MNKIHELIDIYTDVINRRIRNIDGTVNVPVYSYVLALQEGVSVLHLLNKGSALEAWGSIRNNEAVVKFLIETTAEVKIRGMVNHATWTSIIESVADSYSFKDRSHYASDSSAMDADFKKRLSEPTVISQLLQDNPWLVTIVMITYCQPFTIKSVAKRNSSAAPTT